jgi:hypothetical protein
MVVADRTEAEAFTAAVPMEAVGFAAARRDFAAARAALAVVASRAAAEAVTRAAADLNPVAV